MTLQKAQLKSDLTDRGFIDQNVDGIEWVPYVLVWTLNVLLGLTDIAEAPASVIGSHFARQHCITLD